MPVDPRASLGRRSWVSCPWCADTTDRTSCDAGHNCPTHWSHLLDTAPTQLLVECSRCAYTWWYRPDFAAGGRPDQVDEVTTFPVPASYRAA